MPRKLTVFDLFLLAALICMTRLATLLHEVLGHALAAWLGGAEPVRVVLTLFAGGMTYLSGPAPAGGAGVLFHISGILVNLITGGLVLAFLQRVRNEQAGPWTFFAATFSLASVLGGISYLTLASFYQTGDFAFTAPYAETLPGPHRIAWSGAWAAGLVCAPLAAYECVSVFLGSLEAYFPSRGFLRRTAWCAATLGLVLGVYFLLYLAEGQSLAMARSASEARHRDRLVALAQKQEAFFRETAAKHPELSEKEIRGLMDKVEITVSDQELPKRFPLVWPLAFGIVLGGLVAVRRYKPGPQTGEGKALPLRDAAAGLLVAALVLCFLALRGGVIFS
ncbi:MAG: hypothetical protein AB1921_17375 [Thermodesulfobacteriota bacterium]